MFIITHKQQTFINYSSVFIIGALFGLFVPWFFLERHALMQPDPPRIVSIGEDDPVLNSDDMASWLSPKIRDFAEKNKESWIKESGNMIDRTAVRMVWPWGVKQIPKVTKSSVGYVNDKLSNLTFGQLLKYFESHIVESGGDPNECKLIRDMRVVKSRSDDK